MNDELYFPSHTAKCKCPRAKYCTFPCRFNGIAAYIPGDTFDDEDGNNTTNIYCFQQQPTEVWQIPVEKLEPYVENSPQPATVNANLIGIAPEALAQIASAVNPVQPGTLSELVPIVQLVHTAINKVRKAKKQRHLSYDGAVLYLYNEPNPPKALFAKIMEARTVLHQIIAEKRKSDPSAEQKTLKSLAVMSKPSYKKSKQRKKRSSVPAPVPIDQSLRGGGPY